MTGIVAQLYAAVYPGWFLIVALALATVVALVMPSCRGALLQVISRDALAIAASAAVGALLLNRSSLTIYRLLASCLRTTVSSTSCFIPAWAPGPTQAPKTGFGAGQLTLGGSRKGPPGKPSITSESVS